MWNTLKQTATLAAVLTLVTPAIEAAQSSSANTETYTWFGELVSVDTAALKMTVKSRCVYPEAVSELKQFKPGEVVWVVWSGLHDYSDAVRQIRRGVTNRKIDEDLVLPAELVSTEAPNRYVAIRLPVPGARAARRQEW